MLQKCGWDQFGHCQITVTRVNASLRHYGNCNFLKTCHITVIFRKGELLTMTTEQWERENQDTLQVMYEEGGYGVRQFRCGYCRKLLYTQTHNRKYCRYETCGHKALNLRNSIRRRQARGELTCACCGKTFDPVRADARFCSNACRQKSYRQRAAETAAQ